MSEYDEVSNRDHYNRLRARQQNHMKKKKMLTWAGTAITIVIVIFLVRLVSGAKNDKLVGIWKYDQYTEYEFSEDGTGCLCVDDVHYEYTYKISKDNLKLDFTKDVVRDCEYKFEINVDILVLTGGEGTDG